MCIKPLFAVMVAVAGVQHALAQPAPAGAPAPAPALQPPAPAGAPAMPPNPVNTAAGPGDSAPAVAAPPPSALGPTLADRAERPAAIKAEAARAKAAAAAIPPIPLSASGMLGLPPDEPFIAELYGRPGQMTAVIVLDNREYTVNAKTPTLSGGWVLDRLTDEGALLRKGKQTKRIAFSRPSAARAGFGAPIIVGGQ